MSAEIAHSRTKRRAEIRREGFLLHRGMIYGWVALVLCAFAIAGYVLIDPGPRPFGATGFGYLLGTSGAVLMVWLAGFGMRKRWVSRGPYLLKGWLSAHVYLGLALVVIVGVHTGFRLGLNYHLAAFVLMLVVILSGAFGVVMYKIMPARLSDLRGDTTERQLLDAIRQINAQLKEAALPLELREAQIVLLSVNETRLDAGLWERVAGRYRDCGNRRAIAALATFLASAPKGAIKQWDTIAELLQRKERTLEKLRGMRRIQAIMQVWLKQAHLPATFLMFFALSAHIVGEFIEW